MLKNKQGWSMVHFGMHGMDGAMPATAPAACHFWRIDSHAYAHKEMGEAGAGGLPIFYG